MSVTLYSQIKKSLLGYMEIYDLMLSQKFCVSKGIFKNTAKQEKLRDTFQLAYPFFIERRFPNLLGYKSKMVYTEKEYLDLEEKVLPKYNCSSLTELVDKFVAISLDVTNIEYFVNKVTYCSDNEKRIALFDEITSEDTSSDFKTSEKIKTILDNLYKNLKIAEQQSDDLNSSICKDNTEDVAKIVVPEMPLEYADINKEYSDETELSNLEKTNNFI